MNFKTLSKKLLAAAVVVACGFGFGACTENPGEGNEGGGTVTTVKVDFGAETYEMLPG